MCHNPARPIADILVLSSDIGGRGRGKGRAGRVERLQEPKKLRGGKLWRRGEEQELKRADNRRVGDGDKDDNRKEEDDGGTGARRMGPVNASQSGKQRQSRGEYRARGAGQEESVDESAEWSGAKTEGLTTKEEATTAGEEGWERATWSETAWGTQGSGKGEQRGAAMAGGGDTWKPPSATADKVGAQGRHGTRPAERGRNRGRRENQAGESSGVWGSDGGCKASGVAHESPGVGFEEGGHKASGVAGKTRGLAREWEGESSRHRAPTPPAWQSCHGGTKPPE